MNEGHLDQRIQAWTLVVATISVTLFVSPWNSLDPVNLPKILPLGILGLALFFTCFSKAKTLLDIDFRFFYLLNLLFVLQLIAVFVTDDSEFSFKLYGAPGRNTGFFTYLVLTLVCVSAAGISSKVNSGKFLFGLMIVGVFMSLYGLAQWRGFDFFDYVSAYNSDVFGTFGNPNFQSAFMGVVVSALFVWMIFGTRTKEVKILIGIALMLCLFNIRLSSDQGYISALVGVLASVIIYLFSQNRFLLGKISLAFTGVFGFVFVIALFGNGPLSSIIYGPSIQARGFYWRAAFGMMLEKPLTGVGFDGFGDSYRKFRPSEYLESQFFTTADSAHNVPLDLGSSGGLPLFTLYLLILCLTIYSIYKFVQRSAQFDPVHGALSAAWFAYQAQSFLSINQIGLAVWGWALSGLLIGYEVNSRSSTRVVHKEKMQLKEGKSRVFLLLLLGGTLGAFISLPPYVAANKYYKALQSGSVELLEKSTYQKPYDRNRFLYSAQILASNKLEIRAVQILKDASTLYPNNYEVWLQWSRVDGISAEQKAKAEQELKRLETF